MVKASLAVVLIMLTATVGAQPALLPEPRHIQVGKGSLALSRLKVVVPAGVGDELGFALRQLKDVVGVGGDVPFNYVLEGKGDKEFYQLSVKDFRGEDSGPQRGRAFLCGADPAATGPGVAGTGD
ncbi:hypothetical protein ACQ86N_12655 [Puia sp. P3]|uniref:hypothetical protein n=1 Tax=Puia sp. P3 TaxID=3423952 RepID=UPI003D67964C